MGLFLSKFARFEATLPDVSGKVFAITGTTSGTGFVAAQTVAEHDGVVLLLNRPSPRADASLQQLRAAVPNGTFVPIECDLQDFASVRTACATIRKTYKSLYCLSNNAGIMATPDTITTDGYDQQMQTNHLSHFLLTKELFPLLREASKEFGDARIVQHSSLGRHGTTGNRLGAEFLEKHDQNGMLGGDEPSRMPYTGPEWERYFQTKLANSVFCQALHDKLVGSDDEHAKNILSLAAHPGAAKTSLADHLLGGLKFKIAFGIVGLLGQSKEDGTMGLLKAMMDTKETVQGGTLYGPRMLSGWAIAASNKHYETNAEVKDMLWKKSEEAIGASFVV